jgi:tetratricopeptide (TPR) repeat protein
MCTDIKAAKNPVCWLVPFRRNENFVGRESQLSQLEDGLFVDGRLSKMALFALGGMGKTSIALELAYRVRERHPTYSVFWVTATSPESFEQSYRKIGQMLALPGMEDNNANVKTLVRDRLNDEKAGRWFMILDNADDLHAWFERSNTDAPRLADYIPSSCHGCAILTTRNQQIATKFASRSIVEIVEMDMDTSMHLLKNTLIREEILQDFENTRQLLKQFCYLPLAIVQAGAYLNMNNNITLSDYLSFLNDTEGSLVETLSENFEDDWRYQNQQNPVVTTWIVSFEQIQQQKPLAADYLSLLSYIQPKAIPQAFFPPAPSTKQQLEAISCLISYSFLSQQVGNSFDMHRLVHIATRNWLKKTQNNDRYYKAAISRLAEIFPTPEHENRDIWRTYFPHIKFTLSLNREQTGIDRELLIRYGLCLLSDGQYDDAKMPLTEVLEADKRILGINHPSTLTSMANLALIWRSLGRREDAMRLIENKHPTDENKAGS